MNKSLSRKATTYSVVLGILAVAATALPFQYLPNNSVTLFTAIFGTRTLQPLTFVNTISGQVSGGAFGSALLQILCWSIVAFVISSFLYAVLNFILLAKPHNLMLVVFRNSCAYIYLALGVVTATTISVWALAGIMIYGIVNFITFGIALSILSLIAIAQISVASVCLKNSNVKLEITAYEKTLATQI